VRAVREITANRRIARDGQTPRGSYDRRDGAAAIPMVSAWASENQRSLGPVVVNAKSNASTAIPELLRLLAVSGALVTSAARGCPQAIADRIRAGGGDSDWAVTPNPPTRYEQVDQAIGAGREQDASDLDEPQAVAVGHGRQETRTDALVPAPETVDPEGAWRDLSAVGRAITERTAARGRCRSEVRSSILRVLRSAREFAAAVRGHWGIENDLHWQLDVSIREDECRVRTDHAPAHLSVIRRFALGLLKRETGGRRGIETKRLKCAASDEYREKVLFNT
jgi:predicted transposase YbfD/YdcC